MIKRLLTSSLLPAALLLASVLCAQEPAAAPAPSAAPAKVLDAHRTEASQHTIKEAAQQGDVDTLFLAMQKDVEPDYCLGQTKYLPKAKQAQFFARILSDDKILAAAPYKGIDFPGSSSMLTTRPPSVERLSYRLLSIHEKETWSLSGERALPDNDRKTCSRLLRCSQTVAGKPSTSPSKRRHSRRK